jgi:dihydrofolate reductase
MGRNMFGGHPGPWDPQNPWKGWWGDNPPFHHPVFVITHHARPPLKLEGGTTFTFVTDGIDKALEWASVAAGGKVVMIAGGAKIGAQYLEAGLVDEMDLHLVPILLGRGERLFDGVSDLHGLELVRTVPAPNVTHLKFSRAEGGRASRTES